MIFNWESMEMFFYFFKKFRHHLLKSKQPRKSVPSSSFFGVISSAHIPLIYNVILLQYCIINGIQILYNANVYSVLCTCENLLTVLIGNRYKYKK